MLDKQKFINACESLIDGNGYSPDHFKECILRARNTLPKILLDHSKTHPGEIAMRQKALGIWNSYTWAQINQEVKYLALGLKSLGLERGNKVCVIGDNDPEWYWAEVAIQSMGAACVGLYSDAMPPDIEFIVNHSDSIFAFAKGQEQVDKFLEIKEKIPRVRKVIFWNRKGLTGYRENAWLMDLQKELIDLGKDYENRNPDDFERWIEEGNENEVALICYTSGTTGSPKGVIIRHEYLITAGIRWATAFIPQEEDEYISVVSPAAIAEQLTLAAWAIFGIKASFPENPETTMENIREIGPCTIYLDPVQWQRIFSQVQLKMFDSGPIRKFIYQRSLSTGGKVSEYRLKSSNPPWHWRVLYTLANRICLHYIRDNLGLSRLRYAITGGASLGPEVMRWFMAIGVNIKDSYGLTELMPATLHQRIKPGTSGLPVPGVEVRVDEGGEILLRSEAMFDGYYKNLSGTRSAMMDGWLKTGDCGILDGEGQLVVYDRLKELLQLKGGGSYSASAIQNLLKFSPYIKDALVVGGKKRDRLFAIITIDFDNVGKWAEENRLSYTTFVDLCQKEEIYRLIEKEVLRVNQTLPRNARIARYTLLHKEFDPDEGELTKNRKLRRGFLEQRYQDLIQAAYCGKEEISAEAEVRYRDGRQGRIQTNLKIHTLESGV